jgi:hypothetical protein
MERYPKKRARLHGRASFCSLFSLPRKLPIAINDQRAWNALTGFQIGDVRGRNSKTLAQLTLAER